MARLTTCRLFLLLSILFISNGLHAYDESVDQLLEGTLMYSATESKAAMAFDNDASTYYNASGSKMQWVGLDLGEPHIITRIGYTPATGKAENM
ncbi:MAG: discoidin domain-containing protein [Bacteroidaceae bacterium]|nr:discoidin domain-containing protein [Bacteroidaceae bacterium]